MRVFHGFDSLPQFRNATVTVGSFDGVHLGHAMLLGRTGTLAADDQGESVVMTFEPHPRIFFGCDMQLLTTLDEKIALMEQCGADNLVIIPFDESLRRLTAVEFVKKYVIGGPVAARRLVLGYDHRLGSDRRGGAELAAELNGMFGLETFREGCREIDGLNVSSTAVRRAIESGDIAAAERLSGHPYIIKCIFDDGTAAGLSRHKLLPPNGKYRVKANGTDTEIEINERAITAGIRLTGAATIEIVEPCLHTK